jgi:GrpB-like predicted nucleotidyltransferase (UPF0157 family)
MPILAGPDARRSDDAARLVERVHAAVGGLALRIDHIGSTSVPGLRAKDLIDIQVTVRDKMPWIRAGLARAELWPPAPVGCREVPPSPSGDAFVVALDAS